jgi:hypothetical protein
VPSKVDDNYFVFVQSGDALALTRRRLRSRDAKETAV